MSTPGQPIRFLRSVALLVIACISACDGSSGTKPSVSATGKIKVVATVGMVADLVRSVGREHVDVTQICGQGVDPHLYMPTRDDVLTIMDAEVVFYCGLHLEGKMDETLGLSSRSRPAIAIAETIPESQLIADKISGAHGDPHVWNDISLWLQCLDPIEKQLSELRPELADEFKSNAAEYRARLEQLHAWGQEVVATVPEESRVLITSHDAFNYFGRAYGVEVQGVQGLSTESEAGLQRINGLVDTLIRRNVQAVFIESSVSPKNVEALLEGARSRGHEVSIGGTLFSDAMGAQGTYEGTYMGMLDHNLTTTVKALGGQVDAKGFQGKLSGVKHE